jgi:antitoxin (DNA-binding transcriptional repressor) of toxin-antitoxin stability system
MTLARHPDIQEHAGLHGLLDHGHDCSHDRVMATVSEGVLKAKMLEYFRKIEETGEELIVTDNNRPVLRIVPIRQRIPALEMFGDVRGRLVYREDVLTPTTDEWADT